MYKYTDPQAPAGAGGLTEEQSLRIEEQSKQMIDAKMRAYEFQQKQLMQDREATSPLESTLEGARLKIGTFDTGINWNNKTTLAATIGVGHAMGDAWRGIKQLFQEKGIADDLINVEAQKGNERIMAALYGDEKYGAASTTGMFVGAIAEPIGLLMPFGKGLSVGKATLAAVGMGGIYGGALFVDENESRLKNAAIGAALGGPMGYIASKYFRSAVGDKVADAVEGSQDPSKTVDAQSIVDSVQKKYNYDPVTKRYSQVAEGPTAAEGAERAAAEARVQKEFEQELMWRQQEGTEPRGKLYSAAEKDAAVKKVEREIRARLKAAGFSKKQINKAVRDVMADRPISVSTPKNPPKKKATKDKSPEEVVEDIEARAATEGKRHAKVSQFRSFVDSVIQPVYDNIKKYSPRVAHALRDADAIQHRRQHVWTQQVKPWQEFITKKLSVQGRAQLKKLLSNGGFNKATMQFIKEQGGVEAVANAKRVQDTLGEIMKLYKDVGYKIGDHGMGYFPRAVKDLDGLRKTERDLLDRVFIEAQKKKGGKALTPNEKAHIAEHYFTFDLRFSKTAGQLKGRKKREVKDDELGFYHNPEDALHYYIHTAAEDIAKRDFFRRFGHKPGKKGLNPTGSDIDDSVSSLIDQIRKDVPGFDQQAEVARLLRSRFSADVHKTYGFVQGIKNLSYSGTLGNYWSAMTQVGDLVFAFHKYGIRSTVAALLGPKVTSRAELGVEKAMAELQSETMGITSRLADWSFKWSGFDAIDRFGKNVNINASLRKNKAMAIKDPEKFKQQWGSKFGDETDSVINELRNLKMKKGETLSDNMYLMLWNDLADTQPIGLSEMPEQYLKMPNGRILYAYKTFAMKQLNYMRNMITNEKNPVKKAYDLTMFASMFVMANSTVDHFKDYMSNGELNFNDKLTDNLLSLAGTSKYAVDKSQGLGGIILQGLAPVPITQAGKVADKLSSFDVTPGDLINQAPIVGKINKEYEFVE